MVAVPHEGPGHPALVHGSSRECDTPHPTAPAPRRRPAAPRPRPAPGPAAARRRGPALPAVGGDFLSASLALLCREEPLSRAEIGDHADVVAEVADALAAVADRLAHDLAATGPDALGADGSEVAAGLVRARDALHSGSVQTRRGAAELWARHLEGLRAQVEQARAAAVGSG